MRRIVCACVVVSALVVAGGCSATKQAYLTKGNKLFAGGQYQDAALNYRAAIQKDVAYGEAYYRLGLTAIKLQQGLTAYQALLRAVQLLPHNTDAKKKFADVCLGLYLADRQHSQALYTQIGELADGFLSKNRKSYEGLMLKGYLASTDQKPREAIDYFRQALQVNSADSGVVTELAHLLMQNGEQEQGEQLANGLIFEKKTSYGPAYDLLYSFYLNAKRPVEAENILKAKVNNNPKNADYVLQLARHYSRMRNPAEMAEVLRRLLDDSNDFPQARLWVGDFYLGLGNYAEAISYYQQGANTSREANTKVVYQIRNVLALLSEGSKDEALRLAERLRQQNPKDSAVLRIHADLLLARGQRDSAHVVVEEFKTLVSQNSSDPALRMQLGRAYRLKGDLENARTQYLEVIHQHPDLLAARYELAEASLLQQRPQEAVQQAGEILNTQPNDRRARLLYGRGLSGTGDADGARAVFTRLIKDFPEDAEPRTQLGLLALAEKNFPQAIDILGPERANGDARIFAALADAYVHEKQFDQARATLNAGRAKWPNAAVLQQQLANTELLSGHYDLALAQYQQLLSSDPASIVVRRQLAEVYDLMGDHGRAIAQYRRALFLAPKDVALKVSLADALARADRVPEARALYQDVAKAHPENAPALNNAAFFLADTGGDLDEAFRLAKTALAKIPGQPSFSDTIGYIYLKKGMLDSAIQSFSTLVRRYPASPSFHYHLGLALFQKGQKNVARKEFEAALANHPSREDTLRIRELLNEIS